MSAPAFAWALEQGATLGLTPAERLVLMYLADMANGLRVCWPGQERIVRFTGLALRTVRSAIHSLAGRQLIRVEAAPGIVTKYHILRPDTPANGAGVTDRHPGKMSRGTPANGNGAPRQNVSPHPETLRPEPRDILPRTPANRPPDPSSTQERDPRARVHAREEGKDLNSGKEEGGTPPSASLAPPPDAPAGSSDTLARQGSYLDALRRKYPTSRTVHCAVEEAPADEVTEDTPPKTPEDRARMAAQCAALAEMLGGTRSASGTSGGGKLTIKAFPPGHRPLRDKWDQIEAPKRKPTTLDPAQLAALRKAAGYAMAGTP